MSDFSSFVLPMEYAEDGMPALFVVSYDPGVTTGWCVHRIPIGPLILGGFRGLVHDDRFGWCSGQIADPRSNLNVCVDAMIELLRHAYRLCDFPVDRFIIAMEGFSLRMLSGDPALLAPVRVAEKFEYWMHTTGLRWPYVKQSASDAKNVVTDERLKTWDLYKAGSEHARDAQRHGILAARKYASDVRFRKLIEIGQPVQ